ncbi:hypothetical protein K8W59_06195 [Nocardioides rotundus]|uniref:hypothetical protein n=1 Tax=Nocardioides rotundus TaxID=1774216 RepID=UPI001CBB6D90|nr:hypothetical protein [Nocardioides rotundus]UAL31072.1 hypothetical protein K8W59_06195 [Nocardioides rotundus]
MEEVRRLADEDVTVFGEQLQRLDRELGDTELDEATRGDYQDALRAYEVAGLQVPRLRTPEEISSVSDTLATGRYALACVRARVVGDEPPERRTPCFFDPQHGPAARDVVWTMPRRGTRRVPACSRCAVRVEQRESMSPRMVTIDGRRVPYWEAGEPRRAYSRGWFPAASIDPVARSPWLSDPTPGGDLPEGPIDRR